MASKISRRRFLVNSTLALAGTNLIPKLASAFQIATPDIAVVEGTDYFSNTRKSVELLGGMNRFINDGDRVSILINADFEEQGAYVNPEIPLAVIEDCFAAGAKEITLLQVVPKDYWNRTPVSSEKREMISRVKVLEVNTFPSKFNETDFMILPEIKGAVYLKNIEILKKVFETERFINIAIAKHHATTLYTGVLKNMMGLTTRATNVQFHLASGIKNDPVYLAQCIADLNLVRKPDLLLLDGTRFITTGGPNGPGEIVRKDLIAASTNCVAIDTLGASWLDYSPEEILMLPKAQSLGLGSTDLTEYHLVHVKA